MALMSQMINMQALLATQQENINANVDAKAVATQGVVVAKATETESHITTKNADVKNLVNSNASASQLLVNNVDELVNAHTTSEIANIKGSNWLISEAAEGIQKIAPGATGLLFKITPPLGKRVLLRTLYAYNGLTGVTIKRGNMTFIDGKHLAASVAEGRFSIGITGSSTTANSSIPYILGKVNEAIEVSTAANVGSSGLLYAYEIGDIE